MDELRTKVLTALRWTTLARFTAQFATWGITLFVIRLLDPSDYGIMAMGEVMFTLLMLLSSSGMAAALIQSKELSDRQIQQVFGVLIMVSCALFLAQFLAAPWLAAFFQEPRIVLVSRVLAFGFLLVPFISVPSSLMSREIDFKRKALVELVAAVFASITILVLAFAGAGVWALIVGRLCNLLAQAIGLNAVHRIRKPPVFSIAAARHLVRFGGIYTLTTFLWFVYSQADVFIGGRYLDSTALGFYAVGIHLASLAMVKAMPLLNQVALPAYARVQHDLDAVGAYFLKAVRVVSLLAFPVFLGVFVVAPEFVEVVLGAKYADAILPITLLSLIMPMRIVNNLMAPAVNGVGRPEVQSGNALVASVIMPVAFLIGVRHGVPGLCLAWLVGFPFVFLVTLVRSTRVIRVSPVDVLRAFAPPLLAALLMCWIVAGARILGFASGGLQLVFLILTGAAAYPVIMFVLFRERTREAIDLFRRRAVA